MHRCSVPGRDGELPVRCHDLHNPARRESLRCVCELSGLTSLKVPRCARRCHFPGTHSALDFSRTRAHVNGPFGPSASGIVVRTILLPVQFAAPDQPRDGDDDDDHGLAQLVSVDVHEAILPLRDAAGQELQDAPRRAAIAGAHSFAEDVIRLAGLISV